MCIFESADAKCYVSEFDLDFKGTKAVKQGMYFGVSTKEEPPPLIIERKPHAIGKNFILYVALKMQQVQDFL